MLSDGTQEDYEGAAIRHYRDAEALRQANCLDNAGHLIGFAAECAIKHKIEGLPPPPIAHDLDLCCSRLGEISPFYGLPFLAGG